MNKLLLFTLFALFAVAAAQWGNNNNQPQFPNFPPISIDCNAPGANCQTNEMVCDGKGNCKQKSSSTKNGALVTSTNSMLLVGCSIVIAMKMYL